MAIEFTSWIYVVYQDVDGVEVAPEHLVPPECQEFIYGRFEFREDAERCAAELPY